MSSLDSWLVTICIRSKKQQTLTLCYYNPGGLLNPCTCQPPDCIFCMRWHLPVILVQLMRPGIGQNLSNTDTLGTKIIVLIIEVSLFQGENYIKLELNQVS